VASQKSNSSSPMKRIARLKLGNPRAIGFIKKYVIKDWKDESLYASLIQNKSEEEAAKTLAWEFLRRNMNYINTYFYIKQHASVLHDPLKGENALVRRKRAYYKMARKLSNLLIFGIRYSTKVNPRTTEPPKFIGSAEINFNYPHMKATTTYMPRSDESIYYKNILSIRRDIENIDETVYTDEQKIVFIESLYRGRYKQPNFRNPTIIAKFSLACDIGKQLDSISNWLRKLQKQYNAGEPYDVPKQSAPAFKPSETSFTDCIRYLRLLDALFSMDDEAKIEVWHKKIWLREIDKILFLDNKPKPLKAVSRDSNVTKALQLSQDRHYLKLIGLGHLIDLMPRPAKRPRIILKLRNCQQTDT